MRLLHMEETVCVKIMHGRNGRTYRLPELPLLSVDGYCPETRTIYESFGCYYHGHMCQPFRNVSTLRGDTLAESYEQTFSRVEQITRAGYLFKVQCECEFDDAGRPELLGHPIVQQSPVRSRDALYRGRNEAMCLHYKARRIRPFNMSMT